MKTTVEQFRLLFNSKMEEFIDWRLREISYQTAAYAQKIINPYSFSDPESLKLIHREIEDFLDSFEKNLINTRPMLGKGVDSINNNSNAQNLHEDA
jgi:hypothetical protein